MCKCVGIVNVCECMKRFCLCGFCSWELRLKQGILYYGKGLDRATSLSRGAESITH